MSKKKINYNERRYGTVSLPLPLINKIKEKISGTGMHSVSAYVVFILRQLLSSETKGLFSRDDEEKIKSRLKSLGYR